MLKSPEYELLGIEHGARPLAYLNARVFEYEGEPCFTCEDDETLEKNAKLIAQGYRRYAALSDLQYAFLEEHRVLEEGVVYTRYSNGSVVIVNYREEPYDFEGHMVAAQDYLRID